MKKFVRIGSIAAGAVVGLFALIVIGLNLYVQSLGTQARIQQELSRRLGTPVHINAVSVTPWGGLALTGITVAQDATSTGPDFLAADKFELHAGLYSLFSGSLYIKKVALVSPKIIWPQNDQGKWRLPGVRRAETPEEEEVARVEPPPAATSAPVAVAPTAATPGPTVTSESSVPTTAASEPMVNSPAASSPVPNPAPQATVERPSPAAAPNTHTSNVLVQDVKKASVRDGAFRFLDRAGNLVAGFEGVDLRASVEKPMIVHGTAKIARMSAHDRFFLEKLRSPFNYDESALDLPRISARAGGGDVTGAFHVEPQGKDSPFRITLNFHDVQADQIVSDAGGSHGMIQGKLEGNLEATGVAADANSISGTGELVLHDGQLQQYSLLVALGQILQIEELTQLQLQQAGAKYHISPGVVTIDELVLRSPNIRLSAKGTVNFNGKLHLDSQLAINDKVRSQLFKPIRNNFQPTSEPGYSAVDFQVGGTLDKPKTNLVDRVVGGNNLKDFLSGLLGGKGSDEPKKAKKKKRDESATAPPPDQQPSESPAPADAGPAATPTPPAQP